MKKSGAIGQHKWRWHKKTERAMFSLVAIANTKAWGETLIEATEWHAQSNWISSAVSSNLIWPVLWRMTGEWNTFPGPPLPLGVPHTQSDPQTCCFHTQQLADICCVGCDRLLPRLLHCCSSPHLRGNPCYISSTPSVPPLLPQVSLPISHLGQLGLRPPDAPRSWGFREGRRGTTVGGTRAQKEIFGGCCLLKKNKHGNVFKSYINPCL